MISPYLPFTSVVNALRVAIAGGDINFAHVIWVMVAYAAVAAVMLVLGVRAKRRVEKLKEKIHDRVESAEREDGSATETAEGSEGAVDPDGPSESAEEPEDAEAPRGEEGTDSSAPEQEA